MVGVLAYFRKELLRLDREWKAALVWISFSLALPRSKDYNLVALVFPTLVWCKFAIAEWTHSRTHRREIGMGGAIIFLSAWGGQNRHAENFVTFLYSQKKFILEFTFWILCLRLALRSSLTNSNDQKPQPN
ncbi:MAG: hypothetical protein EOP09_03755 [Proteobacteria bacterium]|nr:MAG: hypothetical protein EOP09_03755 [Pseudomonadota bacterium]